MFSRIAQVLTTKVGRISFLLATGLAVGGATYATTACSKAEQPNDSEENAALSGRYEPGPAEYSSIWFDGKGTFKAVLDGRTEVGTYNLEHERLRLNPEAGGVQEFAFRGGRRLGDSATIVPSKVRIRDLQDGSSPFDDDVAAEAPSCESTTDIANDSLSADGTAETASLQPSGLKTKDANDGVQLLAKCAVSLLAKVFGEFNATPVKPAPAELGNPPDQEPNPALPDDLVKKSVRIAGAPAKENGGAECTTAELSMKISQLPGLRSLLPPFSAVAWAADSTAHIVGNPWTRESSAGLQSTLDPNRWTSSGHWAIQAPADKSYIEWALPIPPADAGQKFSVYAYIPSASDASQALYRLYDGKSGSAVKAVEINQAQANKTGASITLSGRRYTAAGWVFLGKEVLYRNARVSLDVSSSRGKLTADSIVAVRWGCREDGAFRRIEQ